MALSLKRRFVPMASCESETSLAAAARALAGRRVRLVQRRPFPGQFSFEGNFRRIVDALSAGGIDAELQIAPVHSKGLVRRLAIAWFARREGGDVTHITGDITFAALFTPAARTIITIHDLVVLDRLRGLRRAVLRALWFSAPARHAALVTVVSAETKRALLSEVPRLDPEKIIVVPNTLSPLYWPREAGPRLLGPPVVLAIGTKANKNLLRLAAALEGVDCRLKLVGRPDADQIAAFKRCGIAIETFADPSDEALAALYRDADLLAFVSTSEGFGMPIIEAQLSGIPVVTSNVSSMPEVAGAGALLCDPFDPASIRDAILSVALDPALSARLVAAGFENAKRFSLETVATQYATLYARLAEA